MTIKIIAYLFALFLLFIPFSIAGEYWAAFDQSMGGGKFETKVVNLKGEIKTLSNGNILGVLPKGIVVCVQKEAGKDLVKFTNIKGEKIRPHAENLVISALAQGTTVMHQPGTNMLLGRSREKEFLLIPLENKESWKIYKVKEKGSIGDVTWHPKGDRFCFTLRDQIKDPETKKYNWKRKIIVVWVKEKKAETLMDDGRMPAWSTDGIKLSYHANRELWIADGDGKNPIKIQKKGGRPKWVGPNLIFSWKGLHQVGPDGKNRKQLNKTEGYWANISISPDGSKLICTGRAKDSKEKSEEGYSLSKLLLIDLKSGENEILKNVKGNPSKAHWSDDGKMLLVRCRYKKKYALFCVPIDGSEAILLTPSANQVAGWVKN